MEILPGIYSDISNDDYHRGPGVSKSGLDLIRRSPLHYHAVVTAANDDRPPPTPAQVIGTAAHSLILEPDKFTREYCLALRQQDVPECIADRDQLVAMVEELNADRLPKLPTSGSKAELVDRIISEIHGNDPTDAQVFEGMKAAELKAVIEQENENRPGKLPTSGSMADLAAILRANGRQVSLWSDAKAEWLQNNGHRTVLAEDQWAQLHAMRDAVFSHPMARALLGVPGRVEHSVYWHDPETGVLCRCRPDYWRNDNIVIDLKTTDDASPEEFARSVLNWRYHVQHPFYIDGIEQTTGERQRGFAFIAVEKRPPYAVAVYMLDSESVEQGRTEYRRDLAVYAECARTGKWPGYGDKMQKLSLPEWYLIRQAQATA